MEAYLDSSATTKAYPEVADIVVKTMTEDYGNPSAMHLKGVEAEKYVTQATEKIAATLKVKGQEIYYTSGGTESNNWALISYAHANMRRGRHIITTAIEHPSISGPLAGLLDEGFTVTRLAVDENGRISLEDLEKAITKDTILVSSMYVNNEIGAVQDIAAMGEVIKKVNPEICFHVDAIQAYGKYKIFPKKMKIDMLSVSGHKIHGPKGIGFLYISEKIKMQPLLLGGGQQGGMRSGTDNVPGIAGLGVAAAISYTDFAEKTTRMREYKDYLKDRLSSLPEVVCHGSSLEELSAPHILNVSFVGVRSEVMLHTLEEKGIFISAGSACASHKRGKSPTLTAIGAGTEELESAVRFSLNEFTTKEEIDYTVDYIGEVLPKLRRFTRR